ESSRPFIEVERAGSQVNDGTVTAPARVEFREGAVSKIGATLSGRVVAVHVRTGDHVEQGAPLASLECPDAAAARSAVDAANASLREARVALEREERMLSQGVGVERDKLAAETRVAELESDLAKAHAAAAFAGPGADGQVELRSPIHGTVISLAATVGM